MRSCIFGNIKIGFLSFGGLSICLFSRTSMYSGEWTMMQCSTLCRHSYITLPFFYNTESLIEPRLDCDVGQASTLFPTHQVGSHEIGVDPSAPFLKIYICFSLSLYFYIHIFFSYIYIYTYIFYIYFFSFYYPSQYSHSSLVVGADSHVCSQH